MMAQQYWNDIGAKKIFEDPLYAANCKTLRPP
jgi:hypothetical protein